MSGWIRNMMRFTISNGMEAQKLIRHDSLMIIKDVNFTNKEED